MSSVQWEAALAAAEAVANNAYAPYSRFHVGAAVIDTDGDIHVGCNVENAAYPEGCCAEASAIAAMVATGKRSIAGIVIWSDDSGSQALTPCGGCRQRIAEFATETCEIYCAGSNVSPRRYSAAELLPAGFVLKS